MKTTISLAAFIAGASAASSPQSVAQSFRDGLDAALQRDTMAKAHRSLHALISSNAHTKAMNEGFKIARNQPLILQTGVSASCQAAIDAYTPMEAKCETAFDIDSTMDASARQTDLCKDDGCLKTLRSALVACRAEIKSGGAGADLKKLAFIINGMYKLCPQGANDPGCFTKISSYKSSLETLSMGSSSITQEAVDKACSDTCVPRIEAFYLSTVSVVAASGQDVAVAEALVKARQIVCTAGPDGKFCFPEFNKLVSSGSFTDPTILCAKPCIRKAFISLIETFGSLGANAAKQIAAFKGLIKFMCIKHGADYCFTLISALGDDTSTDCDDSSETSCSSSCKSFVKKTLTKLGCCVPALITFANSVGSTSLESMGDVGASLKAIDKACETGFDFSQKACQLAGRVKGNLAVRGLTKAVVDANKDKYYTSVCKDMEDNSGVPADDCTVTGHATVTAAAGTGARTVSMLQSEGVKFDFELAVEDEATANSIKTEFESEVAGGTLELQAVEAETAKDSPGSELRVDKQESAASTTVVPTPTPTTEEPGSAASIGFSATLLVAALVALIF